MQATATRLGDATFAFVDVETTGFDPREDRVVEVACVLTRAGRRLESFDTLIDPRRPIPARATAVHHLRDEDVRGAPELQSVTDRLRWMVAGSIVVAHNASFDLSFLPFLRERPTLCSMRFARLVLPDAPNHRLQGLREHLALRGKELAGALAHRALGDAVVASLVFRECVRRYLDCGWPDDAEAAIARTNAHVGRRYHGPWKRPAPRPARPPGFAYAASDSADRTDGIAIG